MGPYEPLRTWVDDRPPLYGSNGSLDPATKLDPAMYPPGDPKFIPLARWTNIVKEYDGIHMIYLYSYVASIYQTSHVSWCIIIFSFVISFRSLKWGGVISFLRLQRPHSKESNTNALEKWIQVDQPTKPAWMVPCWWCSARWSSEWFNESEAKRANFRFLTNVFIETSVWRRDSMPRSGRLWYVYIYCKASHCLEIRTSRLSKILHRPTHGAAKYMATKRAFPSFPKGFPLHVSYSTNLHGTVALEVAKNAWQQPRTLLFEGVLAVRTTSKLTTQIGLDWIATARRLEHGSRNSSSGLLAIGWLRCWKEQLVDKGWPHRCNQEFTLSRVEAF